MTDMLAKNTSVNKLIHVPTGKILWKKDAYSDFIYSGAASVGYPVEIPPTSSNVYETAFSHNKKYIVVQANYYLFLFDFTGKLIWQLVLAKQVSVNTGPRNSVYLYDDFIYVSYGNTLYKVNLSGEKLWESSIPRQIDHVRVIDNHIVCGQFTYAYETFVYDLEGNLTDTYHGYCYGEMQVSDGKLFAVGRKGAVTNHSIIILNVTDEGKLIQTAISPNFVTSGYTRIHVRGSDILVTGNSVLRNYKYENNTFTLIKQILITGTGESSNEGKQFYAISHSKDGSPIGLTLSGNFYKVTESGEFNKFTTLDTSRPQGFLHIPEKKIALIGYPKDFRVLFFKEKDL